MYYKQYFVTRYFADNNRRADESEASRIIEDLKVEFRIIMMEADIDSDVDEQTISALGVKIILLYMGVSR